MSYRSIKKVLGETSLERKCRFLFGACLSLLIGGVFYWVNYNADRLVLTTARSNGRDLVDSILLRTHFEMWETELSKKEVLHELLEDLGRRNQNYKFEIIALDEGHPVDNINTRLAQPGAETEVITSLKMKLSQQKAEIAAAEELQQRLAEAAVRETPGLPAADTFPGGGPASEDSAAALEERTKPTPVFEDRQFTARNEYHYYEPLYWEKTCARCHYNPETGGVDKEGLPLRVIKVVIPYEPTQRALAWNKAILIATWVITVFLAMVALYIIVRYVIVKPLEHLREVSDSISRGDTEMRADISTNDEFEELAESFNRMLRHMTDAQAELRGLNVDLDAKVDELAQVNVQLYEMNRVKGDFLANMSHELRTPLNSIIGFSDVLQGIDSLSDKQKRYARNIQKSGRLLLEMINDILDLAKMEAGKMEVRVSEFRIYSVIQAQCDMVRSLTEEKNIDLEVDVQPDTPPLYQDQVKVQQILTNLLSNAIKFTPEGGRISVTAHMAKNGLLHLGVSDTGVGIAEEDREIIFEKFRQSKTVLGEDGLTREYSGTGLGLSIVKEMCKLLGGEIHFSSELGKGSTFTVTLPWTRPEQPRRDSQLTAKLNELTKPKRVDFGRANQSPIPPAIETASPESR